MRKTENTLEYPMKNTNSSTVASRGKVVAYARVSTAAQNEKDRALTAQIAGIRRYAQDHGLALSGEFVEQSATGSDDDRPELHKMFQEIFQPSSDVGAIIVTHRSRFMRDATKARLHEDSPHERGIRLIAIQEAVSDAPSA